MLDPRPWLLWQANSSPPHVERKRFYTLKTRLLERHGTPDGEDIQYIRCGGTGNYHYFWVRLKRWRWGRFVFHQPVERLYTKPEQPTTIDGYVRHDSGKGRWPDEAALWLALVYDRGLWWKLSTACWHCGWTWLPLVNLRWVLATLRHWFNRARGRYCTSCGRWFTQMFDRRSYHFYCHACRRRSETSAGDDPVPF